MNHRCDVLFGLGWAAVTLPGLAAVHGVANLSPVLALVLAAGIGFATGCWGLRHSLALLVAVLAYGMFTQALMLPLLDESLIFVFPPIVTLAVMAGLLAAAASWHRRAALDAWANLDTRLTVILVMLVVATVGYFAVGLVRGDAIAVGYYARMFVWPMMVIGLVFCLARDIPYERVAAVVVGALIPVLLVYAAEAFLGAEWYRLVHAVRFNELKYGADTDMASILRSVDRPLLNLRQQMESLGFGVELKSMRYMGTDMHHVSSAYLLLSFAIALLVSRLWPLALVPIALLLVTGVKGPVIILGLIAIGCITVRFGLLLLSVGGAALLGGLLIIAIGVTTCDPHVRGLLGGVTGFFDQPWGQGFGLGGHHGDLPPGHDDYGAERGEWHASFGGCIWYKHGYESAFGALIFQTGLLAVLALSMALYGLRSIAARAHECGVPGPRATGVLVASGAGILLTAFFQEEALSPTAVTVPIVLLAAAARAQWDVGMQCRDAGGVLDGVMEGARPA